MTEKYEPENSVIFVWCAGRNLRILIVQELKIDRCAVHAGAPCTCIEMSKQLFASGARNIQAVRPT